MPVLCYSEKACLADKYQKAPWECRSISPEHSGTGILMQGGIKLIVLTVDSDRIRLQNDLKLIKEVLPESIIVGVNTQKEAMSFAEKAACDLVFTDVLLEDGSGLDLAAGIKQMHPETEAIFLADNEIHAARAYKIHAAGYIVRPLTAERLKEEVDNLPERHLRPDNRIIRLT